MPHIGILDSNALPSKPIKGIFSLSFCDSVEWCVKKLSNQKIDNLTTNTWLSAVLHWLIFSLTKLKICHRRWILLEKREPFFVSLCPPLILHTAILCFIFLVTLFSWMMCCPSFCLTFVLFHCLVGGCACVLSCMSRFFSDLATIPDLTMLKLTIIADQATMGPTYVL